MKATGIIRKIDELGRFVIPMEMRNKLDISSNDPLEIYVEGTSIVLRNINLIVYSVEVQKILFLTKKKMFVRNA